MARTGRKSTANNQLFSYGTVVGERVVRQSPAGKNVSANAEENVVSSRYLLTTSEQTEKFMSNAFLVICMLCKSVISF
jgi:hypothetical protein